MTNEARTILSALAMGLWVKPDHYAARTWLILSRWRRRWHTQPLATAKPLDRIS